MRWFLWAVLIGLALNVPSVAGPGSRAEKAQARASIARAKNAGKEMKRRAGKLEQARAKQITKDRRREIKRRDREQVPPRPKWLAKERKREMGHRQDVFKSPEDAYELDPEVDPKKDGKVRLKARGTEQPASSEDKASKKNDPKR